jgi:hypothetical protein
VSRAARLPLRPVAGAVLAGLLLASCGGGPRRAGVWLLPTSTGISRSWHWTARCPAGPAAAAGCQRAGPVLGFAQVNGDEWNLGGVATAGSLDMSVDSRGALTIKGGFASTPPCTAQACLAPSAYTWVRGFPDVSYGVSQCHADTSAPESPLLPLPMRVGAIVPRLIGVTAYSASTSGATYDIAYDLWLHQTGTKRPCLSDGTLEIMVWTDYDEKALLPSGMQVGTASVPFAVGGVAHPGTNGWSVYASNIYQRGSTAPWGGTLWFIADRADVVGRGRVSVDLSAVLAAAGQLLRDNYSWPDLSRHYWLDSAPFGVEFGPVSGDPVDSGPSRFSVRISAYCLDEQSTLADATCA